MAYREVVANFRKIGYTYNLSNLDDEILVELDKIDITLSPKLVRYLLDEVKPPKKTSDLSREHIISVLRELLDDMVNDDKVSGIIGKKTLVRIIEIRGGCPRPWC